MQIHSLQGIRGYSFPNTPEGEQVMAGLRCEIMRAAGLVMQKALIPTLLVAFTSAGAGHNNTF